MKIRICAIAALVSMLALADNNIVTTLKVSANGGGSTFALPRDGWVRLEGNLPENVAFASDKETVSVLSHGDMAVALLKAGDYNVNATVKNARRIGNNMFFQMCGRFGTDDICVIPTDRTTSGRSGMFLYNWNFLRKNVLDSFPILVLCVPWAPEIDSWKAEGRKVIKGSGVFPDGEQCLKRWIEASKPGFDGILTDEFVIPSGLKDPTDVALGYTNPGHGFKPEFFKAMKEWHAQYPDRTFWAWLGLPWNARSEDAKPLIDTLKEINGILQWEAYASTREWQEELDLRYRSRIAGFKKAAGDYSRIVVAPGTYEFLDNNANVDFKVFLDMSLHIVATHPEMKNVAGIGLWTSHYMETEMLRWYALLAKHYAVDGETEMLSPKYGFTIEPKLLKNANWETLDSWKCFGNSSLISVKDAGLPSSPYYPHSTANMLRLEGTESGATQLVTGLVPGRMYSAKTLFVDPAQDGSQTLYGAEIRVEGATVTETSVRQLHDFIKSKKPTFNHIKLVFRANSDKVSITVSSGKKVNDKTTLLVDAVHMMPYFE